MKREIKDSRPETWQALPPDSRERVSGDRLLNLEEIRRRLSRQGSGCRLFFCEETDSTNAWARREGKKGAAEGSLYLAEVQKAGRGRRGRAWDTLAGTSVAMSLLLRPRLSADRLSMLSLVMGLAAAEGIEQATGLQAGIKWPNDLVAGGRKLCGILTETSSAMDYVVVGMGININVPTFPEELQDKATSILLELGREVSREAVVAEILISFEKYYRIFLETGDLSRLSAAYQELLVNQGRQVQVLDPSGTYTGQALGINDRGELLVRREDSGKTEEVYAGEVSVRGIYGYV